MKIIRTFLTSFTVLAIPFLLIMTAIRLVMTPLFLQFEYNLPGFPPDPYGFEKADRMHWSRFALDYLFNDADASYLGDLRFEDGSPLYNERELSHMVDVKVLVQQMLAAWVALGLVLVGTALLAWRTGWLGDFWQSVSYGGWLSLALVIAVLIFVVLSFNALFTGFHRIFFEGDIWLFYMSDTLIRLFPMRFWQDGFILV
ncbi:MAG TPA: TIGR01906 family membrane protein, partial [Anaerolineaceae bacterium]|nr:TIGR01906 family membrane protein [Anaerolineaceae bacterium]